MGEYKKRNIENARQYDRNRYRERKNKGLCVVHGCNKIMEQGVYCLDHKEYYKRAQDRAIKRLSKRLANLNRSLTNDTPTNPLYSSTTSRTL